jgi:hypothetical protein
MPQGDRIILEELAEFALQKDEAPPFSLPNLKECAIDPTGRDVDLLVFHPHDVRSIAAVRSDKLVRHYSETVARLWEVQDPLERERGAVRAMKELVQADEFALPVSRVLKACSWALKPLAWASVPGAAAAADVVDIAEQGLEKIETHKDWLLIQPRMSDVSLRDYLRRKDNY